MNVDRVGGSAEGARAPAAVESEPQGQLKWTMFLAGHLISVAVVVAEIAEAHVCFVEQEDRAVVYESTAQDANIIRNLTVLFLTLKKSMDVSSAIVLSAKYRYPLDMKNVREIPPWVLRTRVGSAIVRVVGPLSWGFVFVVGAAASFYNTKNIPCDVDDSLTIGSLITGWYLIMSGFLMAALCPFLFFHPFAMLPMCCSDPKVDGTRDKCAGTGNSYSTSIVKLSAFRELGWQLHGPALLHRSGAVSPVETFLLVVSEGLGAVLAFFGSFAPEEETVCRRLWDAGSIVVGIIVGAGNTIMPPLDSKESQRQRGRLRVRHVVCPACETRYFSTNDRTPDQPGAESMRRRR